MARLSAQRAVNNFSGGLVTEANELSFPENSLSKAINIEVVADGSCKSRPTFSSLDWSLDSRDYAGVRSLISLKKFQWDQQEASFVACIGTDIGGGATLSLLFIKDGVQKILQFSKKPGTTIDRDAIVNNFDASFTEDSVFFPISYHEGGYLRTSIYRVKTDEVFSSFEISPHYTGVVAPAPGPVREPQTGYLYSRLNNDTHFRTYPQGNDGYRAYEWWWDDVLVNFTEIYDGLPTSVTQVVVGPWTYYRGDFLTSDGTGQYAGVWRVGEVAPPPEVPQDSARPISYRDFKGVLNSDAQGPADGNTPPSFRPTEISAHHAYNLYNAGWPKDTTYKYLESEGASNTSSGVTYSAATKAATSVYPAISDAYYEYLSESGAPAVLGYYSPRAMIGNPSELSKARRGSHILNMGFEYLGQVTDSRAGSYFVPDNFKLGSGSLAHTQEFFESAEQVLETPATVTSMSIIGGRAWYGISGRYFKVAYSQVNLDGEFDGSAVGNYCNCYQENNPNAEILNNVLSTDGGTLDIADIGTIYKILPYRNSIVLFADNGIWAVSGSRGGSFDPLDFSVDKLSSLGIRSSTSVCKSESGLYFISNNDLALVTVNQYGVLIVENLSQVKILSKMVEVCKEFNESPNNYVFFEESTKRLFVNYNALSRTFINDRVSRNLERSFTGSNKSLVYDTRLGSFYEWVLSDNKTFSLTDVSDFASFTGEGVYRTPVSADDFQLDLGLYHYNNKTKALYVKRPLTNWSDKLYAMTAVMDYSPSADIFLKSYSPSDNWASVKDAADREIEEHEVSFEVPFDLVGDMSLSKSVQTATFIQSADPSLFKLQGQVFKRPKLLLKSFWDWENAHKPPQDLYGSIKYPEHLNYTQRKVLINKIKIPGSGRSLSLRLEKPKGQQAGAFKLLGYHLDITADSRP